MWQNIFSQNFEERKKTPLTVYITSVASVTMTRKTSNEDRLFKRINEVSNILYIIDNYGIL